TIPCLKVMPLSARRSVNWKSWNTLDALADFACWSASRFSQTAASFRSAGTKRVVTGRGACALSTSVATAIAAVKSNADIIDVEGDRLTRAQLYDQTRDEFKRNVLVDGPCRADHNPTLLSMMTTMRYRTLGTAVLASVAVAVLHVGAHQDGTL